MYQVLLVDDEPTILLSLRNIQNWEETPYRICGTARNGQEAMEIIEREEIDLIITDLKMPVMDGLGLIQAVKAKALQIPILVLSNYSDFDLVRMALKEGAVDYLLKLNIDSEKLMQCLDQMAERVLMERRNVRERDERRRRFAATEIRSFLTEEYSSANDREEIEQQLTGYAPFRVVCIFFGKGQKPERLQKLCPHIRDLMTALFSPNREITAFLLPGSEMLCLLPCKGVDDTGIGIRLMQLSRQILTYFSMETGICASEQVNSLNEMKDSYQRCQAGNDYIFYHPEQKVFLEAELPAYGGLPHGMANEIIAGIREGLRTNVAEDVERILEAKFGMCEECAVRAAEVRNVCIKILDWIHLSSPAGETPKEYGQILARVGSAGSLEELKKAVGEGLVLLCQSYGETQEKYKREVQEVIRYINAHYREKLSLDQIADTVNLNRSHLCRLFKKEFGSSIFHYLNQVRMEKAAELIRSGSDIYVQDIAALVGIDEPFYFTRRFKEYHGVSPREYAAQCRKKQGTKPGAPNMN